MTTQPLEIEGMPVEVVEPGGASDPFTVNQNPSEPAPATPAAAPAPGQEPVQPVEPAQPAPQPATAQVPTRQVTQPQEPAAPAPEPTAEPETAPQRPLAELIQEAVDAKVPEIEAKYEDRIKGLQSAADRRAQALQDQLDEAREAARKAERESKLGDPTLSDEERQRLADSFALEDERAELDRRIAETDEFYRKTLVASLVNDFGQYGVSPEDLSSIEDPDEMWDVVKDKQLEWYKSHPGQEPTAVAQTAAPPQPTAQPAAPAQPEAQAPAGASAPSDISSAPTAVVPVELSQEQSPQAMAENLDKLPYATIRLPS